MSGYAVADRVAWMVADLHDEDVVYAARLPDGPPLALNGTACLIFTAAAAGGTVEEILARVAAAADAPAEEIREDVTTFVAHLASLGLLTSG